MEKITFEQLWSMPSTYYVIYSWEVYLGKFEDYEKNFRDPVLCCNIDELKDELAKAYRRHALDIHKVALREVSEDGTYKETILVEEIYPREIFEKICKKG